MLLKDNINTLIASAMKERDAERLETLRMIKAQLVNLEKSGVDYNEQAETKALLKMVSAHEDSIKQFEAAGRNDLAEQERKELEIIKEFVPEQPSDEDIEKYAIAVIDCYVDSLENKEDFGMKHMKNILARVKERYNTPTVGKIVSECVKNFDINA